MTRRLAWAIVALCLVYTVGALLIYPSLFPDPAYGLLVQKSMRAGSAWNFVTEPLATDIARDHSYFYTVWSPGQHVIPALLQWPGLTLGQALSAVNILSALAGLAGWYFLFRTLEFERAAALLACAVIAASRTYSFSFLAYVGSDQLSFAAFPYLARAIYVARTRWTLVLIAPAAILGGFFLKNSMAIYVSAWIVAAALAAYWHQPSRRVPALLAAVAATVAGAWWLLDWAYLSRGWTPVTYTPSWSGNPAAYVLPTVMPMLAGTGTDDVLSRVFDRPGQATFEYKNSLLVLLPLAAMAAAWAIVELRQRDRREMRLLVVAFAALVAGAFTVLFATGSGASLNLSRHYMIPGVLLLPLLMSRVMALRSRGLAAAVLVILALPASYGVLSYAANWRRHFQQRPAHSAEVGIAHMTLTPRLVQHLGTLDRAMPQPGSLVVVPIPSLAFEFSHTRVLPTSATSDGFAQYERTSWEGRVSNIVVIAEVNGQTPEEIRAWLATFKDYDSSRWRRASVDGFSFFVPEGQAVDVPWLSATLAGAESDAW